MAIANEILTGRFNRAAQKTFSMKGAANVRQLAGEMVPVWTMFRGAEDRVLESWERFGFSFNPAAGGVGNFNNFRLRNPSGSNAVAVLEKLIFNATLADIPVFSHGPTGSDLTTLQTMGNARWDARGRAASILSGSSSQGGASDLAGIAYQLNAAPNAIVEIIFSDIQEIPLLPGDAFNIRQATANQACNFILWWRERFLEDSERA